MTIIPPKPVSVLLLVIIATVSPVFMSLKSINSIMNTSIRVSCDLFWSLDNCCSVFRV